MCDLCGVTIREGGYYAPERVTIKSVTGDEPEPECGDDRIVEEFDCCLGCWKTKVRPSIEALGATKCSVYEVDDGRLWGAPWEDAAPAKPEPAPPPAELTTRIGTLERANAKLEDDYRALRAAHDALKRFADEKLAEKRRFDDLALENAELRAKLAAAPDSVGDWPAPTPCTPEQEAAAIEFMRVGVGQARSYADRMLADTIKGVSAATARVCLVCGARLSEDTRAYPIAENGFACGKCWDNAATGVPASVWRRDRGEVTDRPPWCTVADLVAAGIPIPFPYDPAKVIDEAEAMLRGPEPDPEVTAAVVALAVKRLQRRGMP